MSKDWDKYIDEAWSEADKDARIAERNAWLDENAVVYGPDHVTSYYVNKNEDHIESGTGRLLSTKESRAKQDIPQWKKFEIGRLEDVDGHIVPGPNALEKDFKQYGKNIAKTGRAKTMDKKRDWDVKTGWEKRIKVDFGSIGPNHVRWSHWTYKERDIVARKVHESASVSRDHGPRSKKMEEWAKENAPIMIDFARDHKTMPDWAHADYRESGIPEHVQVVWQRKDPDDMTSPADWAYDPPYPWEKGEEPAWSAPVVESDIEAANRYRESVGLPPVEKSQNDKLRDALSAANSRPDVEVREFNPETGQLELMPETKPKKIMPKDMTKTPLEKAKNWASETHHGKAHQNRWNRVAATMGADNGADPYTFDEVKKIWKQFGKNARWTVAIDWFDTDDEDVKGMVDYHLAPPMQGHYTREEYVTLWGFEPTVCEIADWHNKLAIIDAAIKMPNYWLEGAPVQATEVWSYNGGDWKKVEKIEKIVPPEPVELPNLEPAQEMKPVLTVKNTHVDATPDSNRLELAVVKRLLEMDEAEADQFYTDHKGDSITWVTQREPSVGPHVVSVLFHNDKPIAKKKSRFEEFSHLPYWTKAQAEKYFIDVKKAGTYSRRSLDGAWNTVKGYYEVLSIKPIALAATQEMEDIERQMDDAIRKNDWSAVSRLATKMIQLKSK